MPGIIFIAGVTLLLRAERKAHAITDAAVRRRRLNVFDWVHQLLLAGLIAVTIGRNHEFLMGATPASFDPNHIRTTLSWIGVIAFVVAYSWAKPRCGKFRRFAVRFLSVAAVVLAIASLPALISAIGAPWWALNVILFGIVLAILKILPSGRTPEQHAADERAADEALVRLTPDQRQHLETLLRSGKYIEAIRDLRQLCELDLRIAKLAMDRMSDAIEPRGSQQEAGR